MFAIIETGGKQYNVYPGKKLKVEKLDVKEGETVSFDKVLLTADYRGLKADQRGQEPDVKIGQPYLEGAKVEAKVLKQGRDEKKIVFKYHSKTRYRKKKGHRQHFTEVGVTDIKLK